MTETVVHVTTLEQWDSVLDVWFKQGYSWFSGLQDYGHDKFNDEYFRGGEARYLLLDKDNDILTPSFLSRNIIEYSEFMAQQKEDKEVKTYYVTQEKLNLINDLKEMTYPLYMYSSHKDIYEPMTFGFSSNEEKALLRYLGGDPTIEFKVKEPLYRLWAIDQDGEKVYFTKGRNIWSTPSTQLPDDILIAPLEEIKKWQTPAWSVEEVD